MARATSSLPVPVSPVISTGASTPAARPMSFQIASIAALVPTSAPRAARAAGAAAQRPRERALLDRALDGGEQQRQIERLGEVVEGAVAHRADGALAVAVGGGDDHRHVAVRARRAARAGNRGRRRPQADVEQDAVDGSRASSGARLAEARGGDGAVAERCDDADAGPRAGRARPRRSGRALTRLASAVARSRGRRASAEREAGHARPRARR